MKAYEKVFYKKSVRIIRKKVTFTNIALEKIHKGIDYFFISCKNLP